MDSKFPRFLMALGTAFLLFGMFLLWQRYSPQKLSFNNYKSAPVNYLNQVPSEIIIPSIKVDLPIYPAQIKNNLWEATTKGASYLVSSPLPGEPGNSIIYGHNWTSLLGPLTGVRPGQKVVVVFSNKEKKTFVINYTSVVSPSDTSILESTAGSKVTIYTCTGFLDTKRFVATATLE